MTTHGALKVVGALLLLLVAGCATTKKVDWDSRVGTYTFDQAVTDYGPPDKQTTLSNGQKVADWVTRRSGGGGLSFGLGVGSFGSHTATGVGVSQSVSGSSRDKVMRLTFDPDGRLVGWSKN